MLLVKLLNAVAIVCFVVTGSVLTADDRPNIVWLLSEDNSIHYLRHYFPGGAPTPRIEQMAAHGLTFNHAFSTAPVCSVARTTLITSCYAPRIGTQYHRRAVSVPMPEGLDMFPAYLRRAGYYTTNNEKKDYNAQETKAVWDESSTTASWRQRPAGKPFFHMQSFATTHESSLHFTAESMRDQPTATAPQSVALAPYHPDTPLFRYTAARYRDNIQKVDQQIGAILDQLAADGLLENTFVFYFGDHGGVLPRGKGYAYESGLHVPLIVRVPERYRQLVPWKDGSRIDGFVSFVDFGPTVLRLAEAVYPVSLVDGRPFLGREVTAEMVAARNSAFGYADRFDEKYDLVRTLRVGKYEYVRHYQPFNPDALHNNYRYKMLAYTQWRDQYQQGSLNEIQRAFFEAKPPEMLFDIEADPHEVHNLADDPRHREQLVELRQAMQKQVKGLPDLSFFPESYLAEEAFKDPVSFGKKHRDEIAALIDIADFSLLSWDEAEPGIRQALNSPKPWERYWGLISATRFGERATGLAPTITSIASSDPELLVRVRAAEFLGLTKLGDPVPAILAALEKTRSGIELGLMLNSVVLLRDGNPSYSFPIDVAKLSPQAVQEESAKRRLEYLTGIVAEPTPKKKNKIKKNKL